MRQENGRKKKGIYRRRAVLRMANIGGLCQCMLTVSKREQRRRGEIRHDGKRTEKDGKTEKTEKTEKKEKKIEDEKQSPFQRHLACRRPTAMYIASSAVWPPPSATGRSLCASTQGQPAGMGGNEKRETKNEKTTVGLFPC